MKKTLLALVLLILTIITTALANEGGSTTSTEVQSTYVLTQSEELKWGISRNGKNPIETTNGINNALKWAIENGYNSVGFEAGEYLIAQGDSSNDNSARINMVSNLTLLLDEKTILRKATNGYEGYSVIHIGSDVKNATIIGGHLIGDRETHNYASNDMGGTHEWGHGIQILGAENVVVDGVKIERFTGDGIYIGGSTLGGSYITEEHLELGGLDENGNPISVEGKIRTVGREQTNFDRLQSEDPHHRNVHMWLPEELSSKDFEIYYYKEDDSFISKGRGRVYSNGSNIPEGADYFRAVFDADKIEGVKVNRMAIANAKNIVIQNCDIGYNRRQGITAGGEDVQILNNKIHHTSGTAPQAGIDIEPGHFPATNHLIKGNEFYNNKIQIVLAYGENATIEENYFQQTEKGMVGVHVHRAYRGDVVVNNNTFKGSGMTLYPTGAIADGNNFTRGEATLHGDNQTFKNANLTDASLAIGTGSNQKVSNIQFHHNGIRPSLYVWSKPVHVQNVTINAKSNGKGIIEGHGHSDSVYDNLTVIDEDGRGTLLPAGTYNNAHFEGRISINREGDYVVNDSYIKTDSNLLGVNSTYGEPSVTINNSKLEMTGDVGYGASIYVLGAKEFNLINSKVLAINNTVQHAPVIKIGPYGSPKPTKIFGVKLSGNEIIVNNSVEITSLDTGNAGTDAPGYTIESNTFHYGKLNLKENDVFLNNKQVEK